MAITEQASREGLTWAVGDLFGQCAGGILSSLLLGWRSQASGCVRQPYSGSRLWIRLRWGGPSCSRVCCGYSVVADHNFLFGIRTHRHERTAADQRGSSRSGGDPRGQRQNCSPYLHRSSRSAYNLAAFHLNYGAHVDMKRLTARTATLKEAESCKVPGQRGAQPRFRPSEPADNSTVDFIELYTYQSLH